MCKNKINIELTGQKPRVFISSIYRLHTCNTVYPHEVYTTFHKV